MTITTISLLCFVAISSVVGTILLLVRDLRTSSVPSGGILVGRTAGDRLRRIPTVFDEKAATSLFKKFDQTFNRLVLESGWDINPSTAFLFLIVCGL